MFVIQRSSGILEEKDEEDFRIWGLYWTGQSRQHAGGWGQSERERYSQEMVWVTSLQ